MQSYLFILQLADECEVVGDDQAVHQDGESERLEEEDDEDVSVEVARHQDDEEVRPAVVGQHLEEVGERLDDVIEAERLFVPVFQVALDVASQDVCEGQANRGCVTLERPRRLGADILGRVIDLVVSCFGKESAPLRDQVVILYQAASTMRLLRNMPTNKQQSTVMPTIENISSSEFLRTSKSSFKNSILGWRDM